MAPRQVEALLARSLESSSIKDVPLMASAAGTPSCREQGAGSWLGSGPCFGRLPRRDAFWPICFQPGRRGGQQEDTQEWQKVTSAGDSRGYLVPQSFFLALSLGCWPGAGVLCFVLGRVWRPLRCGWGLRVAGGQGSPARLHRACCQPGRAGCHHSLASPGGRAPTVTDGSPAPGTPERDCQRPAHSVGTGHALASGRRRGPGSLRGGSSVRCPSSCSA